VHVLGARGVPLHAAADRVRARSLPARAGLGLRLLAAAAFAIDAYVHATGASIYDPPRGGVVTEGNLFRVEAAVASLAALALLLRPTRRVWLAALGVAASALAAVILYRYVNLGAIGPLPDLYEPTWQVPGKLLSAYAEAAAVLLSAAGLLWTGRARPP
jgi:hypothetical protein